jgi:hypothetical protein
MTSFLVTRGYRAVLVDKPPLQLLSALRRLKMTLTRDELRSFDRDYLLYDARAAFLREIKLWHPDMAPEGFADAYHNYAVYITQAYNRVKELCQPTRIYIPEAKESRRTKEMKKL